MKKKLLSIFLAMALVLALLPAVAFAAEEPILLLDSSQAVKGGYADLGSALLAAADGDTVQLKEDVAVSTYAQAVVAGKVTLDGQGHTVIGHSATGLIHVEAGAQLVLKNVVLDANNTQTDYITNVGFPRYATAHVAGGTLIMEEGAKITNGKNGAVYLEKRTNGCVSTFIMNGGELSGNSISTPNNYCGAAVTLRGDSTFVMNGGAIAQNDTNTSWGGAVSVTDATGSAELKGGTIERNTGNKAPALTACGTVSLAGVEIKDNKTYSNDPNENFCGAVCIMGGTTTMTAGAIKNNYSMGNAGGIMVQSFLSEAKFIMEGGEISGNQSECTGGAGYAFSPYSDPTTVEIRGGTISGNEEGVYDGSGSECAFFLEATARLKLSGAPKVENSIWLYTSDYDDPTGAVVPAPGFQPVAVAGDFAPVVPVTLGLVQEPLEGQSIVTYTGLAPDGSHFQLASNDMVLIPNGQDLKLVEACTVKFKDWYYTEYRDLAQTVGVGQLIAPPPADKLPIKAGHLLEGWYTTADFQEGTKWDFETGLAPSIPGNFILYVKWQAIPYTVTFEPGNGGPSTVVENATIGAKVAKPADPVWAGYTFSGWYSDAALTAPWDFESDTMGAGDLTLYAKWEGVAYAIEPGAMENGGLTFTGGLQGKTGDPVFFQVQPHKGFALKSLTVKDASGNVLALEETDGGYTFTMPPSAVTVEAVFEPLKDTGDNAVQTGESRQPLLWAGLALLAGGALAALPGRKKRI